MGSSTNIYAPDKTYKPMAYRFGMLLLDIFGIPTTIIGVAVNWGDIKGTAIFILSLLFLCIRAAFYIDDKLAARKTRRIDHEMKQMDLQDKKDKKPPKHKT